MHDPLNLPSPASDAGPDSPISPNSETRSSIADAAHILGQAENAIDPLPMVREVRDMLNEILGEPTLDRVMETIGELDGALLRASRRAEADHAAEARVLANINRDIGKAFGLPGDKLHEDLADIRDCGDK